MLAYNITNWVDPPGQRQARLVFSRPNARGGTHVRRVCRALGEESTPKVERAVHAVLKTLGLERTQELVKEARAIFAGPGMLVQNGSRRRTLGGIFFQLAKPRAAAIRSK